MRKLTQSAFYSAIVTAFGMAWYYLIGLAMTLAQDGDLGKFLVDTLIGGVICFAFFTYVFYELSGAFERLNRPRDEDPKAGEKKDPKDGPRS